MHKTLYALRKEQRKTQNEMAKNLKISTKQYGKKERGEASFTLEEAETISRFLNTPTNEVFPEYFFTAIVPKMHKKKEVS